MDEVVGALPGSTAKRTVPGPSCCCWAVLKRASSVRVAGKPLTVSVRLPFGAFSLSSAIIKSCWLKGLVPGEVELPNLVKSAAPLPTVSTCRGSYPLPFAASWSWRLLAISTRA